VSGGTSGRALFVEHPLDLVQAMALARDTLRAGGRPILVSTLPSRDLVRYQSDSWRTVWDGIALRELRGPRAKLGQTLASVLASDGAGSIVVFGGGPDSPGAHAAAMRSLPVTRVGAQETGRILTAELPPLVEAARADAARGVIEPPPETSYILAEFPFYPRLRSMGAGRLVSTLIETGETHELHVVWPLTPAERRKFGLTGSFAPLQCVEYPEIGAWTLMASGARLIMTHLTSVQIAACVLGVPCVTALQRTEAPETVEAGANLLAGANATQIHLCVGIMARKLSGWRNPYDPVA